MSAPGTGISQFTVTLNPNTTPGSQVVFMHDVGKLAIAIEVSDALTGQELNDAQVTTSMTLSTATVANNQTVVVTLVVLVRFLVYSPELNLLKPSDARLSFQVSPPAPSPAILSNTPPVNVDGTPALAGVAVTASRSDHKHDVNFGIPVSTGTANAEGAADTLARSNHVHNAPPSVLTWGNGTLGSTVTTRFLSPGYESGLSPTTSMDYRIPRACSARNLRVHARNAGTGAAVTIAFTLVVNGVASALTCSGLVVAVDFSDLVNTVALAAGDLVGISNLRSSGVGISQDDVIASLELFVP